MFAFLLAEYLSQNFFNDGCFPYINVILFSLVLFALSHGVVSARLEHRGRQFTAWPAQASDSSQLGRLQAPVTSKIFTISYDL